MRCEALLICQTVNKNPKTGLKDLLGVFDCRSGPLPMRVAFAVYGRLFASEEEIGEHRGFLEVWREGAEDRDRIDLVVRVVEAGHVDCILGRVEMTFEKEGVYWFSLHVGQEMLGQTALTAKERGIIHIPSPACPANGSGGGITVPTVEALRAKN